MYRAYRLDCAAPLEGDLHELRGKLYFLESCGYDADTQFSKLNYECNLLKCQIASGGDYSGEMVQRLTSACNNVDASIDYLNCHAAHAQKAV